MAIENKRMQQRYGTYEQFTAHQDEFLPNEIESVTSGDPNTEDGKAVYYAFGPGDTKRLMTAEDAAADIAKATEEATKAAEALRDSTQEIYNNTVEYVEGNEFVKKNQGAENAGKALVIDDAGNVVPGKSGADLDALEKIAIKPTATGTDIVAEDSADWRLLDLSAQGWTEQTVTTGKNLSYLEIGSYSAISLQKIDQDNRARIFEPFNIEKTVTISVKEGFKIYARKFLDESLIAEGSFLQSQTIVYDQTFNKLTVVVRKDDDGLITKEDILDMNFQIEYGDSVTLYEPYSGGYPSPRPIIRTNQLFDASKLQTTSMAGATVTNNDDGSFTVSGSGNLTSIFSISYKYTREETLKLLKPGNIYLKSESNTRPYIRFSIGSLFLTNQSSAPALQKELTEDILNNESNVLEIRFYGNSDGEIVEGTFRPMVYQDGDGTWEPYGTVEAWEQPIVNAGTYDSETQKYKVDVKFSGSQLFNKNEITSGLLNNDDTIFPDDSYSTSGYIKVSENKSCYCTKTGSVRGKYYNKNKIPIQTKNSEDFSFNSGGSITIPQGVEYIRFSVNNSNINNVMLNFGSKPIPYEPYKTPQTVTITSNRPLTKWDRLEKRDGKWGWSYRSENVVYDGSTDENWIANESAGTNAFSIFNGNTIYNTIFCNKLKRYVGAVSQIPYGSIQEVSLLIILKIENIATVDELRSWMAENPLNIWHEISNEEWVELPQEEQNALNALTTYYPTTVIQNNAGMEMTVKYVADPENYLRKNYQEKLEQIDTLAGQVATLQEYIIKEV